MTIWKTKEEKPSINEVVLVAMKPGIICLGAWNGTYFSNGNFQKKFELDEIDYWASIKNPFRENEKKSFLQTI